MPSGKTCHIEGGQMRLENIILDDDDAAEFCRVFLTAKPLVEDDVRLSLIEEIRASVVKAEAGRRWIVLNVVELFRRRSA